ncbi:hypothetical protein AB8880_00615 [Alphaproteobacteria bacterium LSUCC0684]
MPPRIKLILSLLVALVIGGYGLYAMDTSSPGVGKVTLALSLMMILAIWIFPETGKVKRKKQP